MLNWLKKIFKLKFAATVKFGTQVIFKTTWLDWLIWIALIYCICQFHQFCGINVKIVSSSCCTLAHARHTGRFDCLMNSLILMTMHNGRGHNGSPEMKGSQPNLQRNLENVCFKTNEDLSIIQGHGTQGLDQSVRYTKASGYRPQPRFLTNSPWSWVPCPGILHRS